jgi:oligoribonuclease
MTSPTEPAAATADPTIAPSGKVGDRIVWVDCEMTGLDLGSDALVEVACVVTDAELNELDPGVSVVIRPPDAAFAAMPDVVREMHTASGLIDEIPHGTTLEAAEALVLDYVRSHIPEARKAQLAGSSVYVDRGFLARDMPTFDAYLHYRLIDVSSIKELVRRWYPRVYFNSPPKTGNHRALADARESIAELRYYRDAVMVASPGPGTDAARGIAAQHVVEHHAVAVVSGSDGAAADSVTADGLAAGPDAG